MVCLHWNFVAGILKSLGGPMEKFDKLLNSFKLMKSNLEYQIMKYFSAMLCQNVVPQNKMK